MKADGGTGPVLTACRGAENSLLGVINNTGVIEGEYVGVRNGRIVLGAVIRTTYSSELRRRPSTSPEGLHPAQTMVKLVARSRSRLGIHQSGRCYHPGIRRRWR